jgi:hypothetical protein
VAAWLDVAAALQAGGVHGVAEAPHDDVQRSGLRGMTTSYGGASTACSPGMDLTAHAMVS